MPNWCSNALVAYGNKQEIDILYKRMLKAQSEAAKNRQWWTYALILEHGFKEEEIPSVIDCVGGSLDDINEPVEDNGDWIIRFWITTRWCPNTTSFSKLFSQYISIKFVFISEEPGCSIYENSDTEHRFFPDKYLIDDSDAGCEYFADDKELIDYVKKTYKKTIKDVSSLDDECEIWTDRKGERSAYFHRFINPMT